MNSSPLLFGIGVSLAVAVGCAGHTTGAAPTTLDPPAACASICSRMDQTCGNDLAGPSCTRDCVSLRIDGNPCNPQWDAFLACALDAPIDCTEGITGCDDRERAFRQCQSGGASDPSTSPPNPDPGGTCSTIPPMVGGGSCSADVSAGQTSCRTSCEDGTGNVWEALCDGSSCQCSYNHEPRCSCSTSGSSNCSSCCPGM